MSGQEIRIGVDADTAGAERSLNKIDEAGRRVVDTMAQIEAGARRAGEALDQAGGRREPLPSTAQPSAIFDDAERPRAPSPPPSPPAATPAQPSGVATPTAQSDAMSAAARTAEQALRRLHDIQARLSSEVGRSVSEGDASRFVANFQKIRTGKVAGTAQVRAFDSIEDWWDGHRTAFKTDDAASKHRRWVMSLGLQGTDYARENAQRPADDDGGDEGGGGEGGNSGGGGHAGGMARRAGSSAMGFLKGGLALAGIGSIMGELGKGVSSAQDEAITTDTTKRRLGDLGVDFDQLRQSSREAADGLGITFVESARLADQFVRTAGRLREEDVRSGDLGRSIHTGAAFARAEGLDPSQGMQFFGSMRRLGVDGGDDRGDRKLALQIADSIAKSGYPADAGQILQAVETFAQTAARFSLNTPNVGAYTSDLTALLSTHAPGLDVQGSSALLGQVDSSFRQGGALGEASRTALYTAIRRPGMNPWEVDDLMKGGWYASTKSVFGAGTAYDPKGKGPLAGQYHGPLDDETNGARTVGWFTAHFRDPEIRTNAFMRAQGLSSPEQAAFILGLRPGADATSALLSRNHLDPMKVNETAYADLAKVANAGSVGDLRTVYGDVIGRKDVSDEEKRRLRGDLSAGDPLKIQDTLAKVLVAHGQPKTDGEQTRDAIASFGNKLTDIAGESLKVLNVIRTSIVAVADFAVPGFKGRRLMDEQRERDAHGGANGHAFDYLAQARARDKDGSFASQLKQDRERYDRARKDNHGRPIDLTKIVAPDIRMSAREGTRGAYEMDMARLQALQALQPPPPGANSNPEDADWAHVHALSAPGGAGGSYSTGAGGARYGEDHVSRIRRLVSAANALDPIFQREAARVGVDWRLLKTIAATESGFNPNAKSRMTHFGRSFGLMQNLNHPEDLGHPEQSIARGADVLAAKIRAHHGSVAAGVRAYNGSGPEADAYLDGIARTGVLGAGVESPPRTAAGGGSTHHVKVTGGAHTLTIVDPHGKELARKDLPLKGVAKPTPSGVVTGA